jgi:hypothetical protein
MGHLSIRPLQRAGCGGAIGDLEPDVARRQVDLPPLGLGQQRAHLERPRVTRAEVAQQVLERQPGVHDVLDDQHVAVFDRRVQVLEDPHDAGGVGRRPVGGDGHEVDLDGNVDEPHEIAQEEHRTLEDANQQQRPGWAGSIVARDLLAQLGDAALQILGGDEHLADCGLACHARGCGHGRESSRRAAAA